MPDRAPPWTTPAEQPTKQKQVGSSLSKTFPPIKGYEHSVCGLSDSPPHDPPPSAGNWAKEKPSPREVGCSQIAHNGRSGGDWPGLPSMVRGNEAAQRGGEDVRIASLPAGLWDNNHWQELGTSAQVSKLVLLQGTVGRIHPQRAKYNQKVAKFM